MIVDTWICVADFRCSQNELHTSTTETTQQGDQQIQRDPQKSASGKSNYIGKFGNIVSGAFTPVLAKHTKSFNLVDTLSVGVDRIQRNFEPLQRQVET
jgi:hypothetical protein